MRDPNSDLFHKPMYKHTHVPDVDGAGLLGVEKQVRQVDGGTAGRL